MENFIEYMWYLFTTPLKKVKKNLNAWYTWCRVIGKRFDRAKEDLFRARREGMIATCSTEMLSVHASDRGLKRYEGEELESFRKRIAMYAQVCESGGTDEGVLLAIRTLGYHDPQIFPAKSYYNDEQRWAEFVVVIDLSQSENNIDFQVLKEMVGKWKEVAAKDNYHFFYRISEQTIEPDCDFRISVVSEIEDTTTCEIRSVSRTEVTSELEQSLSVETTSIWYWDGTYTLYGRTFSVENYKEDLDDEESNHN